MTKFQRLNDYERKVLIASLTDMLLEDDFMYDFIIKMKEVYGIINTPRRFTTDTLSNSHLNNIPSSNPQS